MNQLPLWKLTLVLARIEETIIGHKQHGTSSSSRTIKNLKYKRNTYRMVLARQLVNWIKQKNSDNGSNQAIAFNDVSNPAMIQHEIDYEVFQENNDVQDK